MARTVAASLLAALLLAPAAGAAKRAPDCATTGRTVAANAQARVYMVGDPFYEDTVYGCVYGSTRRTRLGQEYTSSDSDAGVWVAGLHGSRVGYAVVESLDLDFWTAKVTDLRKRKAIRRLRRSGQLDDLLMTPAGSLAMIHDTRGSYREANAGPDFVQSYFVTKVERDGTTMLDRGPHVDPGSLASAPHRLYWTRRGEPRTAGIR
jgi:hypothetical protein